MKILTLNAKQEKKLLKLCKEFIDKSCQVVESDDPSNMCHDIIIVNFWIRTREFTISWYQLCLTELPRSIWKNLKKSEEGEYSLNNLVIGNNKYYQDIGVSYKENLQGLINYCTVYHPVDFLWYFVQECKKNKCFKK